MANTAVFACCWTRSNIESRFTLWTQRELEVSHIDIHQENRYLKWLYIVKSFEAFLWLYTFSLETKMIIRLARLIYLYSYTALKCSINRISNFLSYYPRNADDRIGSISYPMLISLQINSVRLRISLSRNSKRTWCHAFLCFLVGNVWLYLHVWLLASHELFKCDSFAHD